MWSCINQDKTEEAFPGAPAGLTNDFAAVLEGMLYMPKTGDYRIWLHAVGGVYDDEKADDASPMFITDLWT